MDLAIFDVDGTLTRSNRVDNACFARACVEVIGAARIDTEWLTYTHVTDEGLSRQVFERQHGRAPTAAEITRLRERFMAFLEEAVRERPESCCEVPGAGAALARLRREAGWRVAIATGCWRASAELKLRAAEIALDDLPLASAEDALPRPGIVAHAIARAQTHYGHQRFERVVSIGDGVWDVHTAQHLELPMLGVCHDGRIERLRRHGVTHVLADFTNFEVLMEALAQAEVPGAPL